MPVNVSVETRYSIRSPSGFLLYDHARYAARPQQQKDQHDDEDNHGGPTRTHETDEKYLDDPQQHRTDEGTRYAAEAADNGRDEPFHDELPELRVEGIVDSQEDACYAAQYT